MTNKEDRNQKIITIILVILVLIIGIYNLFIKKEKQEKLDTETISVVNDVDRFFTVASCVSKYISYLSIDDKASIYTLLDNSYKKDSNITEENLYNYVIDVSSGVQFQAQKMYSQNVAKNIVKYYVHGYIETDGMDIVGTKSDYYVIAILDEETLTFSIIPYDGEMFK